MSDLLNCPFCGGEAVKVDGFTVACAHGLCIGWTVRRASPHEWNTRALPAVQPDAREAALREAALQDAISHVRQALIDAAHTHGSIVTTRSSAMFTAEIIATNALSRLLSASTGKEVMPDVPPNKPQPDTAHAGNLTARGNAATWALYDANLTRMGALQPSHVNETPKSEHDAANVLTPATKGDTHD